jgi:hypothetical protein
MLLPIRQGKEAPMPDRIAIKELTRSDLSFFQSHFQRYPNVRQKGINLNSDVFVNVLYPSLRAAGSEARANIPVKITVLGPGASGPYTVNRPITPARGKQKNWRLDGQFVPDPDREPGRFGELRPGDLAVAEFVGDPHPAALTLIIISATADARLHARLAATIPGGRRTMIQVSRDDLATAVDEAGTPAAHPIRSIVRDPEFQGDLLDAARGDVRALRRLRQRRLRRVTAADLAAAQAVAERVGELGEVLANAHLQHLQKRLLVERFTWVSRTNVVSPWDFEFEIPNGESVRIEVKSTEGPFERPIHLSAAELEAAAMEGVSYQLWRIYELGEKGAKLRVARDIREWARQIHAGLRLPSGVRPDSFSIDPVSIPNWGDLETIEGPDPADQ